MPDFHPGLHMQEKIKIREQKSASPGIKRTITLPDGNSPTPLGSGLVTKIISTGGGMAVIYEIWNSDLEVKRAIKLLRPDHTQESEERFQTEMKISAKLHHPNIVDIYAVGTWQGLPYIEMEEIEGITVEKLLNEVGNLPVEVCTSIGLMVGRALNYAHNQKYMLYGKEYHGVIHRDLKPSNIMVPKDGIVKLMDFGIATPTSASIHTMEGTVVGTLQYLSPEQLQGREIDVRVDIYSIGTVLYEMLTGVRAFPEPNLAKLVPDKLNNRYIPLDSYKIRIPRPLRELVHKCMRYEKERRVVDVLAYLRALGKIHKSLSSLSPEQIMRKYMNQPRAKRSVAQLRTSPLNLRLLTTITWTLTALAFCGALGVGIWYAVNAQNRRYDEIVAQSLEQQGRKPEESVSAPDFGRVAENAQESVAQPAKTLTIETQKIGVSLEKTTTPGTSTVQRKRAEKVPSAKTTPEKMSAAQQQPAAIKKADQPSILEKLKKKHDTENALTAFVAEVEAGNYANALAAHKLLLKDEAQSKKAQIFKLRALAGAGKHKERNRFLRENDIADGEFLIEKASHTINAGHIAAARRLLEKAATSPSEFMDQKIFRGKLLFLKGRCASALLNQNPSAKAKKDAMSAWYELKSQYRRTPEHKYYKKADEEIRRIAKVKASQ